MIDTFSVGDATEFIRGVTFKPDQLVDLEAEDAVVCMRTKNVQKDLDESDLIAIPKALVRKEEKYLRPGDILISSANSWELVGKCSYVGELEYPATAGGFISIVRPKKGRAHPRFLYHWLNSERMQFVIRHLGRQTTNISNLDVGRFKQLEFPNIGYDTQVRIATILDKADVIRRKREQALTMADNLLKAAFFEMFGQKDWPGEPLSNIVADGTIVTYGIVQAGPEHPDGVPYIRTGDIKDGRIQVEGLRRTSPEIAAKFARSTVRAGDIVMSIRATVGTTAVVSSVLDGANLTQGTARISPGPKVTLNYILNFMRSGRCQDWIQNQLKGATFREITLTRLRELQVPIPPIDLQGKFSVLAEQIARQIAKLDQDCLNAEELFGSLSQRAFRGEL